MDDLVARTRGPQSRPEKLSPRHRRRHGFSLGEILASIAIIAILAAVVIPTVYSRIDASRADAIVQEMQSLQQGILLYYRDVGRYPRRLDYLNTMPPGALGTVGAAVDLCGNPLIKADSAAFRGPYINRTINMINPGGGITKYLLSTGDSVESTLTRTTIATSSGGTQQVIQILVYGPELTVADRIDQSVDGIAGSTTGIIQYSAVTVPTDYIVKWTFAIKNGAC